MKTLYAHLDSYGLKKRKKLAKSLASFTQKTFEKFFCEYREKAHAQELLDTVGSGVIDIFPDSWADPFPLATIRQLAVYINRLYIHDPLLLKADEFDRLHVSFEQVIQNPKRADRLSRFRSDLAATLEFLLILRPFAEAGVIHVTPTVLLRDTRPAGAVYTHDFYGTEGQMQTDGTIKAPELVLPPAFANYVHDNLRLHNARFDDGKLRISTSDGVSVGNMFAVEFEGDSRPKVFMLSSATVDQARKQAGERVLNLSFRHKESVDQNEDMFRHWVRGESQRYIQERLTRLNQDLLLASAANARFITTLKSSSDLATLYAGTEPSTATVINAVATFNLPYFDNVAMKEIVKARQNEAAFADFRVSLDKAFREISTADQNKFQQRTDEICRELIQAPLARIDELMRNLNRNAWIEGTLLAGNLMSSFIAAGATLLSAAFGDSGSPVGFAGAIGAAATLPAVLKAYKDKKDAEDEIRQLPSYFYWQLTERARKQRRIS